MHEMGHAFQSLESMQDERPFELLWPTMDAAEIHSMGMEFLSMSKMDEFFLHSQCREIQKGALERIDRTHLLRGNCRRIPALDLRPSEGVVRRTRPSLGGTCKNISTEPGLFRPRTTPSYALVHARPYFWSPFYYIDYAIAETGAMQLALLDARDPKRAIDVYMELCRLGGAKSVLKIFSSAGLESPFSAENIKNLMEYAADSWGWYDRRTIRSKRRIDEAWPKLFMMAWWLSTNPIQRVSLKKISWSRLEAPPENYWRIKGHTHRGWLYVAQLWVSDRARNLGIGSKLMESRRKRGS